MPWVERSYDQAIHTGDFWLGAVMDKVESLGLRENTVIVFTSDHGEETYEHGDIGHGQGLFPELMHIPLVLAGPGIAAGASTDRIVSNADIFGYLSALAEGQDASTNRQPLTANESAVFYSTERGQWKGERMVTLLGIEEQDWALHFAPQTDELMLFDLKIDPNQFVDVAKENLGVANRMKEALLERYKEALRVRLRGVGLGAGAGAIEALQDIGYL
jgi:arylsulfatase A-like enzyme